MIPIRLSTIIALFLFFSVKGIQVQAQDTKLNQAELMKQFIGTWKNIENDTTYIWECKSFGSALEFTIKTETKGKVTIDAKSLLGTNQRSPDYELVIGKYNIDRHSLYLNEKCLSV